MHGVGQAGDGVGKAGGGIHAHPQLAGDAAISVGHVYRRLLVAGVNEPEIVVSHDIQHRQHVVARQGKDVVDALQLQGLGDEVTTGDSGHVSSKFTFGF